MTIDADRIRSQAELELEAQLKKEPRIVEAIRQRTAFEKDKHLGIRRSLLATALRLTPEIAPDMYALVDRCKERLGVTDEVELYVYPSPQFNAAMPRGERNRSFVLLSSSLVEALDSEELMFVIGHELGHHHYQHHDIPLEVLADPERPVPAVLAIRLRAWQRFAEISSDRAGLWCVGSFGPAARSLFKLSSGLSQAPNDDQIAAFVQQAAELYREVEQSDEPILHRDWLASHPFSPVRLRAAEAFMSSEAFVENGTPLAQVDQAVSDLMTLMEPAYIDETTEEAEHMRRLVLAMGVAIAKVHGAIETAEMEALKTLLGPKHLPAELSAEALEADLPRRIEDGVAKVRRARRAQVIRDVALVAKSDGRIQETEAALLYRFARDLQVDESVVDQVFEEPVRLD